MRGREERLELLPAAARCRIRHAGSSQEADQGLLEPRISWL